MITDSRKSVLRHHPNMTDMEAEQYAKYSCDLAAKAKSAIRDINPLVFINFMKIYSK